MAVTNTVFLILDLRLNGDRLVSPAFSVINDCRDEGIGPSLLYRVIGALSIELFRIEDSSRKNS
jgi:hypothetical protein